ncbi:MAG: hypothetical protein U9O96_05720 [Candidatus Thermoplasmatota archaeon]|nr:hypothetical protein [Candidatus Thermoplasmatota archaeon]
MLNIFPVETLDHSNKTPFSEFSRKAFEEKVLPNVDDKYLFSLYQRWHKEQYGVSPADPPDAYPNEVFGMVKKDQRQLRNEALLDFVEYRFDIYMDWTRDKNRYIYCRDGDGNDGAIRLSNRFSYDYCEKVEKRMRHLMDDFRDAMTVMCTLTIDPARFEYDKTSMWENIKPELNRFLTNVRNHFKRKGQDMPPYLATIEAQSGEANHCLDCSKRFSKKLSSCPKCGSKNFELRVNMASRGNPHIHILFFNAARLMDWRQARHYWKLGGVYLNKTPDGYDVRYPVNYVLEYVLKTYTDPDVSFSPLTQALSWFFGVRSYSCSHGLVPPLNSPEPSGWIALAFVMFPSSKPDGNPTRYADYADAIRDYVDNIMLSKPPT